MPRPLSLRPALFNRRPRMSDLDHDEALRQGLLRYCPICDGYEITDRTIAVVGEGDGLYREAKFLSQLYHCCHSIFRNRLTWFIQLAGIARLSVYGATNVQCNERSKQHRPH